jgi:hypothetical protein
MAIVEELIEKIADEVEFYWSENKEFDEAIEARRRVYDLVAAAEARGIEKGAEQEKERILAECGSVYASRNHMEQSGGEFVEGDVWYYFPASVLAPKEKP